jgi:hypothetical protein
MTKKVCDICKTHGVTFICDLCGYEICDDCVEVDVGINQTAVDDWKVASLCSQDLCKRCLDSGF